MNYKKSVPYVVAIVVFAMAAITYFHPVLKGQKIAQSDITQFRGMAKEIQDFRAEKNTEPYWTGSTFSGMPAYQLSAYYPNDFVRSLDRMIRFLPRPADYVFLYFFGFFILLLSLKVNWKLAILGALSFGFSTYLIIIFGAGHNAKAHAIGYMPLVLAGVVWVFQRRYLLGFFVTALAMALEIYTNHPQMTYYLGFCLLILGVVELINAIKEKLLPVFAKQSAILIAAILLGIGINAPRLMAMKEYSDYSTRGKSELTIAPDGSPKIASNGLDEGYITQYSYAKLETFNLFVPRFMGGGTVEKLDDNSEFYQLIAAKAGRKVADEYSQQVLTYWGDQPIVEAPAYIGAVLFFLFFLGFFLVKGKTKQWLVAATIFSIVMSWGKNFEILTNVCIDYIPLYNKFRAVSSIQIIAELCVPILGFLGLKAFFSATRTVEEKRDALKKAITVFGGLVIFGFILAHLFASFEGLRDEQQYSVLPGLIDALIADRKSMLLSDSLRSIGLMGVSAAILWFLLQQKLKQTQVVFAFAIVILFDLISVDKRYVNEDDFSPAKTIENPFTASSVDRLILQDSTQYRVANFAVDPMQDGRTSYFHNSIGGYHAAKMGRYQELFDYQISQRNMKVLDMLNAKYIIFSDAEGDPQVQLNTEANGNAWFVEQLQLVNSANEEMQALDSLDSKRVAVLNSKILATFPTSDFATTFEKDATTNIQLEVYDVTELRYHSTAKTPQFAVFSEIYYKDGWNAYIDGVLSPHYNVDYVLRGMYVPAGDHTIEFKFEPSVIQQGKMISLSAYALLLLLPVGWFFYKKKIE